MFFIVSKVLHFLLNPIVWVALTLLLSLIVKHSVIRKKLIYASLLIVLVFGNSFIVDEVFRQWEIKAISLDDKDFYNYGIVLSGMTMWDKELDRVNFHGNVDRLLQTLPLHQAGIVDSLIISGGDGSTFQNDVKESVALKRYLESINYNTAKIILEPNSKNTHENALFSLNKMDENGVNLKAKKVLLITSAGHMRRSLACFKKQGINCTPYVTNRLAGPRKFVLDHLFIPNAGAMHAWKTILHELIGFVIYSTMGYI